MLPLVNCKVRPLSCSGPVKFIAGLEASVFGLCVGESKCSFAQSNSEVLYESHIIFSIAGVTLGWEGILTVVLHCQACGHILAKANLRWFFEKGMQLLR